MERNLIDLPADLPGLDKKFEIDTFQVFPKQNQLVLTGSIIYIKDDRELKDVKTSSLTLQTPNENVYDPTNPEDISVSAIKSILPIMLKFYNDRIAKDNPVTTEATAKTSTTAKS